MLFTPGTSCELCGTNIEKKNGVCKMCGSHICMECIDKDHNTCLSCMDAKCNICGEYLSSRACDVCGELVCEDHGRRVNAAIICDRCRNDV